jgi:multiple sugar transport system permease protein
MPWLITLAVFWIYPFCSALYMSLTDYQPLTDTSRFIGWANYAKAFSDPMFYKALTNTLIFSFGTVPITATLALLLATAVNSRMVKFREFFRSTYFLPSVTSMVVIALIFSNLYSGDGYINSLLKMLNMPYPARGWLLEPSTALLSIMGMDVWMSTGYYMVLFLAGMQTIPTDLYEAADLSGATAWQKFWRITFPLLKPTLLFVLVINTIKSFQVFIEIYVMTKGGPMGSTLTMVYMVFDNAFDKMNMMGYAAALAFIIFGILLVLSIIQITFIKRED